MMKIGFLNLSVEKNLVKMTQLECKQSFTIFFLLKKAVAYILDSSSGRVVTFYK